MKIQPIQSNKTQPIFGILKEHRETRYGHYTKGTYKDYNIEIFDVPRRKQKLIYVSDKFLNWVKSKLFYIEDNVRKILRSERIRRK